MLEDAAPAPRRPCANAETRARDLPPPARWYRVASRRAAAHSRCRRCVTSIATTARSSTRPRGAKQRADILALQPLGGVRTSPFCPRPSSHFNASSPVEPRRTASTPRRRSSRVRPVVATSWSRSCPDPSGSRVTEPSAPSSDLSGSRERARLILGVGPSGAPRCTPRAHSNRLRTDALDAIALDAGAATKSSRACSLASERRAPDPRDGGTISDTAEHALCAERTRGERPRPGRPTSTLNSLMLTSSDSTLG